jgi:pimeloyl-ACP methyl ester carboxylesterase
MMGSTALSTAHAYLAWVGKSDISGDLKDVKCPTLVLRGQTSDLVTPEAAAEMMTALPHAHFEEIEQARHILHHDNPLAVIQSLRRFFATLPLPPGNSSS